MQAPHQVWRGGGDLEVQLADWAIFLLDMGSVACRDHQFGITGCLGQTEVGPPRACGLGLLLGWGKLPPLTVLNTATQCKEKPAFKMG